MSWCSDAEMRDLTAAADALAAQARTVANTIDICIAAEFEDPDAEHLDPIRAGQLEVAVQLARTLEHTLHAIIGIYSRVCSALADRAAVIEEHRSDPSAPETARPSSALLAQHARTLAQSAVTRDIT